MLATLEGIMQVVGQRDIKAVIGINVKYQTRAQQKQNIRSQCSGILAVLPSGEATALNS